MAQVIAQWRTMTGVRRTSSSQSVNLIVEAYHNTSEGEVARVDFSISNNGGSATVISVTTRADATPDDTTEKDPLPGNFTGPAPIPGAFSTTILMSSYTAGYIDITPTAYPVTGTSRVLETIRVYNDKDGTDRRPSTKVIYVHPYGDDTRDGSTSSLPVRSINRAIDLCRMGGTSGGNVGGATIYLTNGVHSWGTDGGGNPNSSAYYTEGHHWLTITRAPWLTRDQVVIQRNPIVSSWPNCNGTAVGQSLRIRLKGVEISGLGLPCSIGPWPVNNVTGHFWSDGCLFYGSVDNTLDAPSVNIEGTSGGFLAWNPTAGTHYTYATGTTIKLSKGGFSAVKMVRGCLIKDVVKEAIQIGNSNEGYCNIQVERVHQSSTVKGYFNSIPSNSGLTNSIVNGKIRISATASTPTDFGTACTYLVGKTIMGVVMSGWSTGNNGIFTVFAAGYINGYSYVDLNPTATSPGSAVTGPSGTLGVVRVSDGSPWTTIIHSDVHQYNVNNSDNTILSNIRCVNTIQAQGLSANYKTINNAAIINFFDGCPQAAGMNSYLNGMWNHVIFRNCTFAGTLLFDPTVYSRTNSEIIDCVIMNAGFSGTLAQITNGTLWSNNHYGPAVSNTSYIGASYSTGPFFRERYAGDIGDATAALGSSGGTGTSTLWSRGSTFFTGSKGCYTHITNGNWGLATTSTITQVRTVNRSTYARSDIVTCGVPFTAGTVWSEAQTLTIHGATASPQKVQWRAFPARHPDGSIKYAKISYKTDLTASQVLDATLRVNSTYSSAPFTNSVFSNLGSTIIEFSLNGNIVQIPFSSATLIEGGGPEDQFARYRVFTRHPQAQNIWYEMTFDVLSGLDIVKFYFRFGNSQISPGYVANPGPYANTAAFTFSAPVTLTIRNSGDNVVYLQNYELSAWSAISGGKRYTIVDNAFWQANASSFPLGFSKSMKGVIMFTGTSNTALAEKNSQTCTMALNWMGKVPGYFATNQNPGGITSDTVGRNYIESTFLGPASSLVTQHPYQPGKYSNNVLSGAAGDQGISGSAFWQSALYHIPASGWPVELPYVDFSIRSLAHRPMWFYETNMTPVTIEKYPNLVVWYGTIHDFASQDRLGYGSNFLGSTTYPSGPSGEQWTGINEQHGQISAEAFGALLTCDYLSLRIIDFWKEILAFKYRTTTPNAFMAEVMGSRDFARPMLGAVVLYDYTEHPPLKAAMEGRINLLYSIMNGAPSGSSNRWGCRLNGIDKLKFVELETGNQVGNLQNNRTHFYAWQDSFVCGALYQAYKVLSSKVPSSYVAARAKELAYQMSAANVLYYQQKFGPGSTNNWDCIEVSLTAVAWAANMGPIQQWALGSSVRGITSGATATVFRVKKIDGSGGWDRVQLNLKNVSGTFVSGEAIQNLTSGVTTAITATVRGYQGVSAYYSNAAGTEAQRQTPLTVSQMEEWETTPWDEDVLGALKYIHFYMPYTRWQRTAAAIVLAGIADNYYTTSGTVTTTALNSKAVDILLEPYNSANALTGAWDTSFWPYSMLINNMAALLVATGGGTTSVTVTPLPVAGSGRLPLYASITTVIRVDKEVSIGSPIGSTSQVPTHAPSGVIVINPIVSPQPVGGSSQIPTATVTAYIIVNVTYSQSDSIGSTTRYAAPTVTVEVVPPNPTIVNVVLEMLLDGPQATLTDSEIPPESDSVAYSSTYSDDSNSTLLTRKEVTTTDTASTDGDSEVVLIDYDPNTVTE